MNDEAIASRWAYWLYQTMTDYRWYSRVGLTWDQYQDRIALERTRLHSRLYEISIGIL